MRRAVPIITILLVTLTTSSATAQLAYFRCLDPKDKCIVFKEEEKAACPECKTWKKAFLSFADVLKLAKAEQRAADVDFPTVASNFFADAASTLLYGIELGAPGATPPKTRALAASPEQFGLRALDAPQVGALAIVGDVAGIVTEQAGRFMIAYPSWEQRKINLATPDVLQKAEESPVKYLAPAEPRP